MANGDPLYIGIGQPPFNRATSATLLVHNGSAFGNQNAALWVQRHGAPVCASVIRGDNFSTGPAGGQTRAGVLGMIVANTAGVGVLGTATGSPNLFFGETGVMGVTNSFGVVGRSLTGLIVDEPGAFVSGTGVVGQCDAGVGVHGVATSGWGIIGQSDQRVGVTGKSVNGIGVEGVTEFGIAGVRGKSRQKFGVIGASDQGVGVAGVSPTSGVQGWSTGSGSASIGVSGWAGAGTGVQGDSTTGIGVTGRSPRGWAGYFEGDVMVSGAIYIGGSKSAVVPHPDGTQRALFCLESPESYFEDFGEVTLTGASIAVKLDRDFAALVKRSKYQVFLTSYGPEALYVRKRNATGFEIARVDRGAGGKSRTVKVGYRIVARRADVNSARLPKVKAPARQAEMAMPDLSTKRVSRKEAGALSALAKLEPLPATPRIPSPDIKTIAKTKPVETKRKRSRAANV